MADVQAVDLYVAYRIANAPVRQYPFPHIYVRDVLPADYYAELQRCLPPREAFASLEEARGTKGYPERSVMPLGGELPASLDERQRAFWRDLARWVFAGRLGPAVLDRFAPIVQQRIRDEPEMEISDELLLVRDRTRYSLGPHTDSPRKVVSVLFYLPADDRLARHGTSLYTPRNPSFTSVRGDHYPFEDFERVETMPFVPNSVFAFAKTPVAFHGVEPVAEEGVERNLLLYDLRFRKPAAAAGAEGAKVRFSL